jgi:UTP:GlnB (protein PII) uridylyltransferase
LGADSRYIPSRRRSVDVAAAADHNIIELTGTDRPGLLSEVSAVLTSLKCNVVSAEIWTHNTRAAAVMRVTDEDTGLAVMDAERLERIREKLSYLFRGGNLSRGATVSSRTATTHTERRLHQMMLDDGDYEQLQRQAPGQSQRPNVTVRNWNDKDYSVVTIRCKDRSKLLFDTVCTLTDLQYVVFHANIDAKDNQAYQVSVLFRMSLASHRRRLSTPIEIMGSKENCVTLMDAAACSVVGILCKACEWIANEH